MAKRPPGGAPEAPEVTDDGADNAVLNAPDLNEGVLDVERYELPGAEGIDDPHLREVWEAVRARFAGGSDQTAADDAEGDEAESEPDDGLASVANDPEQLAALTSGATDGGAEPEAEPDPKP